MHVMTSHAFQGMSTCRLSALMGRLREFLMIRVGFALAQEKKEINLDRAQSQTKAPSTNHDVRSTSPSFSE